MWLSEKAALGSRESGPGAEIGTVTAGGAKPSVMLGGERRKLEVVSPGGIFWAPMQGEQVLVTHCGDEDFVSGALRSTPELVPGEVCVRTGSSSVHVYANGMIELVGTVNEGRNKPGIYLWELPSDYGFTTEEKAHKELQEALTERADNLGLEITFTNYNF